MKKVVSLAIVGTLAVVAVIWFRENKLEVYRRFSGRVTDANNIVSGARTYRANDGHILLTLPETPSAPFIYLPEYRQVLSCNSKTFVSLGVIGLQKRDRNGRYPCAGSGKQELQQEINSTPDSLAFTSWRNGAQSRISIRW